MISDSMTTETLRKKFKNNFDLCNFAINIGKNTVLSGSGATLSEILDDIDAKADERTEGKPDDQK